MIDGLARPYQEGSYYYNDRRFSTLGEQTTEPIPADELISTTILTVSWGKSSRSEERHIDAFERTEDVSLGSETSVSVGRAGFPVRVGVERWEVDVGHWRDLQLGTGRYLHLKGSYSTLEVKDTVVAARAKYYDRLSDDLTLAARVGVDFGDDLEEGRQFILGGNSGLRGYPARQFTGNKRFRANLEARLFSRVRVLSNALGLVAFVDAGNTWGDGISMDLGQLKYGVGLGIRIAATKVPGEPITRIDVGYPLNGDGRVRIVFGVGQQF